MQEIVFCDEDTAVERAKKTLSLYVGTHELKTELAKLGIEYVKVYKGLFTFYILRGKEIGKLKIKL